MAQVPQDATGDVQRSIQELNDEIADLKRQLSITKNTLENRSTDVDEALAQVKRATGRPRTLDFNDVFRGAGGAEAIGYVPSPGQGEFPDGFHRFLRSDATWKEIIQAFLLRESYGTAAGPDKHLKVNIPGHTHIAGALYCSKVTSGGDANIFGDANITGTLTAGAFSGIPANGAKSVQVFTSGSGTYTLPASTSRIIVELVGGGGGGGGVDGVSTSASCGGGGGGAGAYCKKLITSPSSTYSYAVGASGAGGTAGPNNGSAGGDTTFGSSFLSAGGGAGGSGDAALTTFTVGDGGAGGAASGGDINIPGGDGQRGVGWDGSSWYPGSGGASIFGGTLSNINQGAAGTAATQYGAGGAGASTKTNNDYAGGDGAAGIIIVWEFA